MIEKTYQPAAIEPKHYRLWEESGAFTASLEGSQHVYTIMMPPPNVTGSLHIGHALNYTLQDVLVRYQRMRGVSVLWQPGMDHAGIATQMVVERKLDGEGKHRRDLGREAFVERVWKWKEESGGMILNQMRRIGISPDWTRECFTMDEKLVKAVRKAFIDLYKDGLIYRDKRLVNWDPKFQTAISDLEVNHEEVSGNFWHFSYPLEGSPEESITIATTRPETLLGDAAVAVHPEDARYQHLIGKFVDLPIAGRRIPIIGDDYCDPEFGTGAVKITPAHDFNDFEVGKRHGLEMVNILNPDMTLSESVPASYQGLDRFEARKKIVAEMEGLGHLVKIEQAPQKIPHGDRSGARIEPLLTDQWFVDAKTLAQPALEAVKTGQMSFVPKTYENTYFSWLENIQPWCISRQLWWGHRIPAWYGPDGHIFVADTVEEAQKAADHHYGAPTALTQDEDVLDTWFSSGLWPFSTLGWPEKTPALEACYPGDVLVTGNDLIFFWVARMMMMGLHFMKAVPFKTVYMHALVRDEHGQKMSKSKGNVIDPLTLIDRYGADAIRFSLALLAGPGRDVNFSEKHVESARNFATKLWNVSRYCQMNGCAYIPSFDPAFCQVSINQWIVREIQTLALKLETSMAAYRFDEASSALYHFAWGTFCDWYLEFTKPILAGGDEAAKQETRATTAWILGEILHMLNPFMPFITEELWAALSGKSDLLISAPYPTYPESPAENVKEACEEAQWLIGLIGEIRSVRSEVNVSPGAKLPLRALEIKAESAGHLKKYESTLLQMARLSSIEIDRDSAAVDGAVQVVIGEETFLLNLGSVVDLDQERRRLQSSFKELESEIVALDRKLSNQEFVAKAPPAVVEKNQQRRAEAQSRQKKVAQALERLQ